MPKELYYKKRKKTKHDDATSSDEHSTHSCTCCSCKSKKSLVFKLLMVVVLVIPLPFLGLGFFLGWGPFQEAFLQSITTISTISTTASSSSKTKLVLPMPTNDLIHRAMAFVQSREQAYDNDQIHARWKMRGHGHLYHYHNLTLAAFLHTQKEETAVLIFNVHPATSHSFQDCHLLSLWARVNGPELWAGKPQPINITTSTSTSTTNGNTNTYKCYWKFQFGFGKHSLLPGNYRVDVKLVQWNGMAPVHLYDTYEQSPELNGQTSQCADVHQGQFISQQAYQTAPFNTSLMGFKLYTPLSGCCEMCRRTPFCRYWATPPHQLPRPNMAENGCELFLTNTITTTTTTTTTANWIHVLQFNESEDVPQPHILYNMIGRQNSIIAQEKREQAAKEKANNNPQLRQRSRRRRRLNVMTAWGSVDQINNDQVAYFLGCGWSFHHTLEFPCLSADWDDQVFMAQSVLSIPNTDTTTTTTTTSPQLPLCEAQDEFVTTNTNQYSLANQRYRLGNTTTSAAAADSSLTIMPTGVGRWVRKPAPTKDVCPMPYENLEGIYSQRNPISRPDPDRPACWYREDLTPINQQCKEINCHLIKPEHKWNASTLQHERDWMGVWNNYHCDYTEFTNRQLNECFQTRQISAIEVEGASIAAMMKNYFLTRLANVTLVQSQQQGSTTKHVWVKSLQWPHLLWQQSVEMWETTLQKEPDAKEHEIMFWVTPFFASSEREPYVHLERVLQFMNVAERILTPKGYQMINLFDPSAAFTYDTGGQGDGLHVVGPPMKVAVTKVFHHLCSKVVKGTRI